ncbi:hypothetical protein QYE76_015971 [Lolium multiflorum]|uniref:Dual specificity protein phosphatase DSP8 n=1 Tax=Lolium multiflorum TaxID=4521 RepID=A0AAD8XAA6_LOLMU|nr:hypothetical protein QYE76_015971 [Lolium multiflorum]
MKITELREGSDGEEEAEGWEMVDLWEEAGGSSAGEPVRDDVSTGGGGAGAATGTGGDAATRRGGANVEVRGGVLAMGRSGGEAVTRRGGVDEVTGRGGVDEVARRDVREVEGRRGVVDLDLGGGRGAKEEDWEDATEEWAVPDEILRSVGEGMDIGGGVGAATSSGSVRFGNLDFGGEEEDWEEAAEGWELVEASSARGSMPGEVLRGFAVGMDIGGGEVTAHARGGWADFAKTCLIAGAARLLFYPAVARNAVLDRYRPEFHWWDRIDESIILGAVPFRSQIPQLMELGVKGVVTLTEPFETLVPTSDYEANDMENLKIPTPDYYAAPSIDDICRALLFMNRHASGGHSTYIHCKAGRGRSTTVVLCYLIRFKHMTTEEAWKHTYSIRPRISLTRAQRDTVTQFGNLNRTGHLPMETDDTQEDMSSGGRNHME